MDGRKTDARAFVHRGGGVRIAGTVIACDAAAGTDLVFLSHAPALGVHARRALPRLGGGRRQLLATEQTLALLGPVGERLKAHALPPRTAGRSASATCAWRCSRRGSCPGPHRCCASATAGASSTPGQSAPAPGDVRAADALCLDATFARRGVAFPARAQALAEVGRAVRDVLARGGAPVVLVDPVAIALDIGAALAADRIGLAAHRSIVQAAIAYRHAGCRRRRCSGSRASSARARRCCGRRRSACRRAGPGRAHRAHLGRRGRRSRRRPPPAASARRARHISDRRRPRRPDPLRRGERGDPRSPWSTRRRDARRSRCGRAESTRTRSGRRARSSFSPPELPGGPIAGLRPRRRGHVLNFRRVQPRDGRDHRHLAPRPHLHRSEEDARSWRPGSGA